MTDPISVAGIILAVLGTFQSVSSTIESVRDAPTQVENIRSDLYALSHVLREVSILSEGSGEGGIAGEDSLVQALNQCQNAARVFTNSLNAWTKRSGDGQLAFVDRMSLGYRRQRQIGAFREHLSACKQVLSLSLEAASLARQYAQSEQDKAYQRRIDTLEAQLAQSNSHLSSEIARVNHELQQLNLSPPTPTDGILQQLQIYRAAAESFHTIVAEAIPQTANKTRNQRLGAIETEEGSRAAVGLINVEGTRSFDQDIRGVTTTQGSRAIVGVAHFPAAGGMADTEGMGGFHQRILGVRTTTNSTTVAGVVTGVNFGDIFPA